MRLIEWFKKKPYKEAIYVHSKELSVNELKNAGWVAYNQAYFADKSGVREAYQEIGKRYYDQARHEWITQAFAYSDAQNEIIDTGLQMAKEGREVTIFKG